MCQCHYPSCKANGTKTWALVDLCEEHHEAIERETRHYYAKRLGYQGRLHYMGIMQLIPWSRKE